MFSQVKVLPEGTCSHVLAHMVKWLFSGQDTVNQLIFAAINFCGFVFIGIFAAIYFRGLKNWTIQKQCKMYLWSFSRRFIFANSFISRIS